MRRPKHEIEAEVPHRGTPGGSSRPQIRRQVERICELIGLEFDDLQELHIQASTVNAVLYHRNDEGELYRDEFDKLAIRRVQIPVDVSTFLGDERDR